VAKPSKPDPPLGTVVRRLRQQRSESLETLGFRAGITSGALADIELARTDPAWSTVLDIAGALELKPPKLVEAVEDERQRMGQTGAAAKA
jgi:transcriptional regulator with XRE-family HTH domain